jgi:hydroxymethylglutaryl-CoA reductase
LKELVDSETQTDAAIPIITQTSDEVEDNKILRQLHEGKLKHRGLEKLCTAQQAVRIRRTFLDQSGLSHLSGLPYQGYDYTNVNGACCENLIGYVPVPAGIVGPLRVNGEVLYMPLATTEGALIASTNRGCKALETGVKSIVFNDRMTRAPVLEFESIIDAVYAIVFAGTNDHSFSAPSKTGSKPRNALKNSKGHLRKRVDSQSSERSTQILMAIMSSCNSLPRLEMRWV